MADVYLVKNEYLKQLSGINNNTDFELLKPTIIMVQDIYIQQILGTPLYNDLKTKIIADSTLATEPDYKALINDYIAKVIVWYVKMESSIELTYRYTNAGVQLKNGENNNPSDVSNLKFLMDKWRINAERYAQLLTDHLMTYTDVFPKYLERTLDGMTPIVKNYTNGMYIRDYTESGLKHPNDSGDIC